MSISGTYGIHIQGFDWGCAVDQVIVALDAPLDNVEASDFAVTETKMATDYTDPAMAQVESSVPRTVTEAALSDDGKTLTLTLACGPIDGSSLEYTANMPSDGSESPWPGGRDFHVGRVAAWLGRGRCRPAPHASCQQGGRSL